MAPAGLREEKTDAAEICEGHSGRIELQKVLTRKTCQTLKLTIDEVRFSIGKNMDEQGRARIRFR
jgi:hypothetical protein